MTLTPEQREALNAAVLSSPPALVELSCFAAGMRYAYEDAARICESAPDLLQNSTFDGAAAAIRSRIPKDSA